MFFLKEDIARFSAVTLSFIKTEQSDRVFTIILNRPEKRNAFTPTMVNELALALAYAQQNRDIWCVVVKAEGPVFCAGMDLAVFQNPELDVRNSALPEPLTEVTLGDAFKQLRKPSIALVQGSVFAGGFLIIASCTFVVATKDAGFSLPEVKRGIFPMQVMALLLKVLPPRKVLELCILGSSYTAQQTFDFGLVTHLGSQDNIEEICRELQSAILENSPFAIQQGMEAFYALSDIPESEQQRFLLNKLQQLKNSEDAREGIAAFQQKRKPVWKNK